jgi:acetate---CoA ligase (ADP-forming)
MVESYPAEFESSDILRDGTVALTRPIKEEDSESCLQLFKHAGSDSQLLKFGHSLENVGKEDIKRFCDVNYDSTFGLSAILKDSKPETIIGVARYYKLPKKESAEIFILVEESYRSRGLATLLLQKIASIAHGKGIATFEADVTADNRASLSLINTLGFTITAVHGRNTLHVLMPVTPTRRVVVQEEERERKLTVESIHTIFYPKSVAVIGASRSPGTIGYWQLRSLLSSGYTGVIYPVNPNAQAIQSIKSYASVLDIPGTVDLAIIVVPAAAVIKAADECGRKGVKGIICISDGFKETGPEGAERERQLREVTLVYGMRLVGPNCMGVINTDPVVSMNATFSQIYPSRGNISFLSQSGAMGLVVLEYAKNLNTGIATFASVGNRADISSNDMLQYWETDPNTKVILLYLESFGNPRKFVRITRRVSSRKPIVVVKSGRTQAGVKAASSHTGALATSEIVTQALFRQTGVIRADAVEELFDIANLLSTQPLPRGRRLVIVTNGGGPGILAADASVSRGLTLPEISPETAAKIKPSLERNIRIANPMDTTAQASAAEFQGILRVLAEDKDNDAVLAIFCPPVVINQAEMVEVIRKVSPLFHRNNKPLLACFMGAKGFQIALGTPGKYVPSYSFPENAISSFAKIVEYAERRAKPKGRLPRIAGIKHERARKIINIALSRSVQRPLWLMPDEIASLLECYDIKYAVTRLARSPEEAEKFAGDIGYPVAVKLASATILHKSDVGGVQLNLASGKDVVGAFMEIRRSLERLGREKEMEGVTVQRMLGQGIETIVGMSHDQSFGPLIMFGMGGVNAELINDVAFRLHPLSDIDAEELISSIKMAKVFDGYRGNPPSDKEAMKDLLLRLSVMIEDIPQINELDFNPVKVLPKGSGYCIVDARIAVS